MKQLKFFTILLTGILAASFQSCSKENHDEPNKNDIVGTWKISEVSTDDGVTFKSWSLQTTIATFNDNGTYSGKGYFGDGSGTWKQSGKVIITYVNGEEYLRYEVKQLTSSTCTLIMSMEGSESTIWIKCIKINDGYIGGKSTITKTELEAINAFEYNSGSSILYIKFRNGIIYTKQVDDDGIAYNQDEINYTLSGDKISMELGWQKTSGTIYKVKFNDGKTGIVMDFDGTFGIATWLSQTFKESNYKF